MMSEACCFVKMLFRRVQLRRRRFASILLIVSSGIVFVLYFEAYGFFFGFSQSTFPKTRVKFVKHVGNSSSACRLPNLDPFHPSLMKFMKDLGKLQCSGERHSNFRDNVLEVKGEGLHSVRYSVIGRPRGDDFHAELSDPIHLVNEALPEQKQRKANLWSRFKSWLPFSSNSRAFVGKATVKTDFVRVDAGRTWGRTQTDMLLQVSPKEEVLSRPLKPGGIPLDVALIMLDSVSDAHFRRKMPNTLKYLIEHQTTVFLQGETIVGDGTTAAMSAMLTGIAEKMQPEARRSEPNAEPVDKWRWIFKDFKEKGYATLFSEDDAKFGSFSYRLHGFKEPPSDHYSRPFWLEALKIKDDYCLGSQAVHNISLEYLLSFYRGYKEKRKFAIIAINICHDDQNALGYADEDLKSFIKKFDEESFLKNTLLVIFGDHGARFSVQRKTIQGKLEERLPYLSLTAPKWFTEKYPDLYTNLIHNSKVLTTPFDVYATLRHILSYPSYPSGITTGQSLLNRIDKENRTCENAGVEEHWCPCLNFEEISIDDPWIEKSAEFIISYINNLMFQKHSGLRKLCHQLVLKEITHGYRDMPSGKVQFLKKTHRDEKCDSCGLSYGKKSVNTLAQNTMYHLQLETSPNDAFYEATVKMKEGEPSLVGDISRIDAYSDQPHCIMDRFPLLRKYCYCLRQRSR